MPRILYAAAIIIVFAPNPGAPPYMPPPAPSQTQSQTQPPVQQTVPLDGEKQ